MIMAYNTYHMRIYMSDNDQDGTIGNQQERLFFEIGYILAMIDGEGSICIAPKYKYKGYKIYAPRISIYNNNPHIIQRTINALKYLKADFSIYTPRDYHGEDSSKRQKRVCYRIYIEGHKRCKKFIEILLKYPSGKKERLELLKDFCEYRLSFTKHKRENETYSEKVAEFREKMKLLNSEYRGTESSETTRFSAHST